MSCTGGACQCADHPNIYTYPEKPDITSTPLPPWPTAGEIRKIIREELQKAGVI